MAYEEQSTDPRVEDRKNKKKKKDEEIAEHARLVYYGRVWSFTIVELRGE